MRVLCVARYKKRGYAPFVTEQVEALKKAGVECRYFPVCSRGMAGYLLQVPALRHAIREFKPDIVHAHYGLCGLFANLQRKVPVVTTYHGSDINESGVRRLSRVAIGLSRFNIFVSKRLLNIVAPVKNSAVIPCGINFDDYPMVEKEDARRLMGLKQEGKYILFAGAFDNPIKNASLAQAAVSQLQGVQLLELKGYSRSQVALLMQAVDAMIMTSITEGSPQVVKEAMACGCPIVSVDVGDVKERVKGVEGCFVSNTYKPEEMASLLDKALSFGMRTDGRNAIIRDDLTGEAVAYRLKEVYNQVSNRK